MNTSQHNVIIIGGGPAGCTAAIYAARAALSPVLVAGYASGGQLMTTTVVENFPGFPQGVQGPDLMRDMRDQAMRFGAAVIEEDAVSVALSPRDQHTVRTDSAELKAPVVIIATGASAKTLGVPGEERLMGRGVATCAVCDGAHFRDKKVAVVGGGDAAIEEVLQLSRIASQVHLLVRGERMRASAIMQNRVQTLPNVQIHWNTQVAEVLGERRLEQLRLRSPGGDSRTENFDGLFVAIGHRPNTWMFGGQVPMDADGYIQTIDGETRTAVPGVFVAGDAFDFRYRQAITAAASGCKAALEAERYLMFMPQVA
jgi:thioredoxin reductase (NADPH)